MRNPRASIRATRSAGKAAGVISKPHVLLACTVIQSIARSIACSVAGRATPMPTHRLNCTLAMFFSATPRPSSQENSHMPMSRANAGGAPAMMSRRTSTYKRSISRRRAAFVFSSRMPRALCCVEVIMYSCAVANVFRRSLLAGRAPSGFEFGGDSPPHGSAPEIFASLRAQSSVRDGVLRRPMPARARRSRRQESRIDMLETNALGSAYWTSQG